LRPNLSWQDGKPLTADDVVFTINKILDPAVKSPHRASWEGVTVQKIDAETVRFTLKKTLCRFPGERDFGHLARSPLDNGRK